MFWWSLKIIIHILLLHIFDKTHLEKPRPFVKPYNLVYKHRKFGTYFFC